MENHPSLLKIVPKSNIDSDQNNINEQNYSGFWLRFVTYLIDFPIIFFINFFISFIVGFIIGFICSLTGNIVPTEIFSAGWFITIIYLLSSFCYLGIFQAKMEGTLGKYIVGIRVVNETFTPISIQQALLRYVFLIISCLPFFAGLIAIAFDPKKQGWHDKGCKTLVVYNTYLLQMRAILLKQASKASSENIINKKDDYLKAS